VSKINRGHFSYITQNSGKLIT